MHRTLRKLLPDAVGESQWVVAANVDIRGFTTYSLSRDSAETALYLKKVYVSVIDISSSSTVSSTSRPAMA